MIVKLRVEVRSRFFLCMRGCFSKHTFTDLLSDLGLHLLHLKQRFLPVAFCPSALCAVHNKSCETQHAISQWQHAMQWWSSKCVWDSERWLNKRVCLWQHVKRLFLFKILAWTGISGAKIKRFLSSSKSRFNTGKCAKMHARSNFTTPLPTHPARARHTQLHQVCTGEGRRWSCYREEQWSLCAFRSDEASAGNCVPLNSVYLLHIWGVHCSSRCTFISRDTTYPLCTAAAARSTPQWTPRWPVHCPQAALWQWCDESSPLGPGEARRKDTLLK